MPPARWPTTGARLPMMQAVNPNMGRGQRSELQPGLLYQGKAHFLESSQRHI